MPAIRDFVLHRLGIAVTVPGSKPGVAIGEAGAPFERGLLFPSRWTNYVIHSLSPWVIQGGTLRMVWLV